MRTKTNGELRLANVGEVVTLTGWVSKKRDLGGVVFIDLRDRYGITQLIVNPENKNYDKAVEAKNEYVLKVTGTVVERSNKNKNIPTGDIEVEVTELEILNVAELPPFLIKDQTDALEETRMRYRYLDLRRPQMQNNMLLRHKTCIAIRNYLDKLNFIEIETPFLGKSTPEGARDFLVPSRVHPESFYALPQSPQIYKQLLMVGGMDRYFQIARCFRDEDLRADRQLEFTQVDLEMSFIDEEDIFQVVEGLLKAVWKDNVKKEFEVNLKITAKDNIGFGAKLLGSISNIGVNITKIFAKQKNSLCEFKLTLKVKTVEELKKVTEKISNVEGVKTINRSFD
jgi:aspartyl-tRNA synthetase